jgi:hypothetical protein
VWPVAVLGAMGLANWMWLAVEASTGNRTLVVDFFDTANPVYRASAALLPDGALSSHLDVVGFVAWGAVLALLAAIGWSSAPTRRPVAPDLAVDVHPRKEHEPCSRQQAASLV